MKYFARIICNKDKSFTRGFDTKEELAEGLKEFFVEEIDHNCGRDLTGGLQGCYEVAYGTNEELIRNFKAYQEKQMTLDEAMAIYYKDNR